MDDLSTPARIRRAALELFAAEGLTKPTVRTIAERAGVSPALVIHHFGSRDGLVEAVNKHVMEELVADKKEAISRGLMPSLSDYEELAPEYRLLLDYLRHQLRSNGPLAPRIFDDLVQQTLEHTQTAVDAGLMNAPSDPEGFAAVQTAFGLGIVLLEAETSRHLGGEALTDPAVTKRYSRVAMEMFTRPLFRDTPVVRAFTEETQP